MNSNLIEELSQTETPSLHIIILIEISIFMEVMLVIIIVDSI